jgi:ribosome-binding factor A
MAKRKSLNSPPDRNRPNRYLCPMGEVRQQKFGKLIQKELSEIFQRDKRGFLDHAFITIAEVRMSPDLSVARVYISMMLAPDKNRMLDKLNTYKKEIRKALGEKIRNQARIIPELVFFIDEVEENALKMDDLISSLNIPPAEEPKKKKK